MALKEKLTVPDTLLLGPDLNDAALSSSVSGFDENGSPIQTRVVTERALTLYLNSREIVTMMTIGDHPDLLAVGYLKNQNMLEHDNAVTGVDYDEDLGVVVVRTERETNYEEKLKKKVRTSGCAQGTVFGDVMDSFEDISLDKGVLLRPDILTALLKKINLMPSLYLTAGAIHGCVLADNAGPIVYMEDVGRHNAVDKVAGWMHINDCSPHDKVFYTTGRLTSEMVIKCVMMRIPILVSRSGFTAWGVELAQQAGLTLIGRAKGSRFTVLSGAQRVSFDLPSQSNAAL